jgi:triosephosphate isomerase
MRLKIVAGNWKMNHYINEAEALITETLHSSPQVAHNHLNIFAVPFPYLTMAQNQVKHHKGFAVAAQNCSSFEAGAYTGEVSPGMLASIGVSHCLVGHSERRSIFNEKSSELLHKLQLLIKHGITPIWCCGEQLNDRNQMHHFEVVSKQLNDEVFQLNEQDFSRIIIAYEPVWAIGTGLTASPAQAQEMHAFIRSKITSKYHHQVAEQTSILYGGSCNADNAAELFALADVDGGLIGGASLKAASFVKLISIMHELH